MLGRKTQYIAMKPLLNVKNVGPIKDVSIDINRINLFIGPQSSGKSTLAKLISFCQWLEKDVVMHQGVKHIDSEYLGNNLRGYHKLAFSLDNSSRIEYKSSIISFSYRSADDFDIEPLADLTKVKIGKITYVPSERNYVAIPHISTLTMEDNYVRAHIFDWLRIRSKFTKSNPVDILGLAKYYYDSTRGDIIVIEGGKEITLDTASSGLQAAVPLLVFLTYGSDWIFHHEQDISFEKYSRIQKLLLGYMTNIDDEDILEEGISRKSIKDSLEYIIDNFKKDEGNKKRIDLLSGASDFIYNISKPHFSSFIIEEPEENLFPATQYALVKHIFKMLDNINENRLVITTHSPYVLTAVNNHILAGNIISEGKLSETKVLETGGLPSYLNYDDINAFVIRDGRVVSIKDEESRLISADLIDAASEDINNDFDSLLQL